MGFIFTFPDSPRWLLEKGRTEEARRIMSILEDTAEESETGNNDVGWIQASLSKSGTGSFCHLFKAGEQRIFHCLVLAVSWVFSFMVTEVTPVGFSTISNRYYTVYAATNAFIIPVVYFCFPETNGRTLEEIDNIFA